MTKEIRSRIWNGSINVRVILSINDSNDMTAQREFYCVLRRNSYFPMYFKSMLVYFKPHILVPEWGDSLSWWLESEDVPIKWNLPIGLNYDFLTQHAEGDSFWTLTLHYRDYPDEYVIPLETLKTVEDSWLNRMKESCFICNGSSKNAMSLSKEDSTKLWKSIETGDYNNYSSIMPKIIPSEPKKLRHLPLRLYLPGSNQTTQHKVVPYDDSDSAISIGSYLHKALPDLFPSIDTFVLAKPLIHGVSIDPASRLDRLFDYMMYIDGFLHVSIIMIE